MENNTIDYMDLDSDIESANTSVDDIDAENVNLIFVGIDQSGSMSGYTTDMFKCLTEFKGALTESKEVDEILLARANFESKIDVGGYKKVSEFDTGYSAGGSTSLYDVIVEGEDRLIKYMDFLRQQGMRVKAVFAIFSDGEDVGSRHQAFDAKAAVATMNGKEITTAFISFGSSAFAEAKALGFTNILNVSSSATELRKAFNCLSKSVIESSKSVVATVDNFFV